MSATVSNELAEFVRFASEQLGNGGADLSPEECLRLWRLAQRECVEANEGIRRGLSELDAGFGRPLAEFTEEFRRRNQITAEP